MLVLTSTSESPPATPGTAPREDFRLLTEALGGRLSYPPKRGKDALSRLEEKTASDWRQAFAAARDHSATAYLSLSEKAGLPLALLASRRRRVPHVLIAHRLTSGAKRKLHRHTGILHRFDRILVLCETQERYLRDEARVPSEKVHYVWYGLDDAFWTPEVAPDGGYVLSVGRERRDYETLVAAARSLPEVTFEVIASSPWSRSQTDTTAELPPNMTWRRGLSYPELRARYAGASLVVLPLQPGTEYAAGGTGLLEAMAMGKPTVLTATTGLAGYATDGENARVVTAGDSNALGSAIRELLADRPKAARLGEAARQTLVKRNRLDDYVRIVSGIVREVIASR